MRGAAPVRLLKNSGTPFPWREAMGAASPFFRLSIAFSLKGDPKPVRRGAPGKAGASCGKGREPCNGQNSNALPKPVEPGSAGILMKRLSKCGGVPPVVISLATHLPSCPPPSLRFLSASFSFSRRFGRIFIRAQYGRPFPARMCSRLHACADFPSVFDRDASPKFHNAP